MVPCPLCGREMRLKTLRYAHKCGRGFDAVGRAQEQRKIADAAVLARMGKARAPCVEHRGAALSKEEELIRKYSAMLNL